MAASFDYIIAGGGTAGCVLAHRLSFAGHSVGVFEAGPEDYNDAVMTPLKTPTLHGTPLQYNYNTVPQKHLDGRTVPNYGGRLLSGSSAVNYGQWTRCHSADYDAWAQLVGDKRWSYAALLPYFKKTQRHHEPQDSKDIYGFEGYMNTKAGARKYPLQKNVYDAFSKSGLDFNPAPQSGSPLGFGAAVENWYEGKRQPAGKVYDVSKAAVTTNAIIKRVIIDPTSKTATGIELADGRTFNATKEVIVCCGAFKTPQLLMLSGVGPSSHLAEHGIKTLVDLPVGQGLHDKANTTLYWKLRHPEQGLAMGAPALMKQPGMMTGFPIEWVAVLPIDAKTLEQSASEDKIAATDPYVAQPRGHVEVVVIYAPIGSGGLLQTVPHDGSYISTPIVELLPTSRGSIKLANADPASDPTIDPNYLATATDRAAMRAGLRAAMRAMETPEGQEFVAGPEDPQPPGPHMNPLTSASSDADLDERVRVTAKSFFQAAGSCPMGKVVDPDLRVLGVRNLRVCDMSILPLPLTGHYQAPTYAVAEAAADMLLGKA